MTVTKLLIQPGAGVGSLIDAIDRAKEIIQIVIFRFDRGDIEMALKRAAKRGVFVHALVAFTSSGQGGDQRLRRLEMRLLADGVSVARTSTDLVRYHDKLMIVDKSTLFMLGFNYTYLDTERSRSFGIISDSLDWVQDAERLFTADTTSQTFEPHCDTFLVSPGNSRKELLSFISGATRQLLIYDGKLSDPEMLNILASKVIEGVEVRVIGAAGRLAVGVEVARPILRLHAQVIVRDGEHLYLGSQSLRSLELDARREVGVLLYDQVIARQVQQTFEMDWENIRNSHKAVLSAATATQAGGAIGPLSPEASAQIVQSAVKEAIMDAVMETLQQSPDMIPLKETVKEAAKEALAALAI